MQFFNHGTSSARDSITKDSSNSNAPIQNQFWFTLYNIASIFRVYVPTVAPCQCFWMQQCNVLRHESGKHETFCINSSPPSAAYVRQWIGSALVQIMACRRFGAKPLSTPMLGYCHFIVIAWSFTKMHLKMSSAKWRPFCPGGDELRHMIYTQVCTLFIDHK